MVIDRREASFVCNKTSKNIKMFCRFILANAKLQVLFRFDNSSWVPEKTRMDSLIDLLSDILDDMLQVVSPPSTTVQ